MELITVEALKDFQVCNLYHHYKYEENIPPIVTRHDQLNFRFNEVMRHTLFFFFYRKRAGYTPNYRILVKKWEKLWFPSGMDQSDIASERRERNARRNLSTLGNIGAKNLLQFYNDFVSDPSIPYLIDEPYQIKLDKDHYLSGNLDLILKTSYNTYKVIQFLTYHSRPSFDRLSLDIAYLKAAYEYRGYNINSATFYFYDVGSPTPGYVPIKMTNEYTKALKFWLNERINLKTPYPRRGYTVYCNKCPYDLPCKKYKYPS